MYASFKRCKSLKGEKWGLIYLYLLFGGIIDLTPTGRTMIWTFTFFFVNLTLFLKRLWAFVEFSNLFINLCVYDIHWTLWLLTEIQLRTSQPPFSEIEVLPRKGFWFFTWAFDLVGIMISHCRSLNRTPRFVFLFLFDSVLLLYYSVCSICFISIIRWQTLVRVFVAGCEL